MAGGHRLHAVFEQEPSQPGVVRPLALGVMERVLTHIELFPAGDPRVGNLCHRHPPGPAPAVVHNTIDGHGQTDHHLFPSSTWEPDTHGTDRNTATRLIVISDATGPGAASGASGASGPHPWGSSACAASSCGRRRAVVSR